MEAMKALRRRRPPRWLRITLIALGALVLAIAGVRVYLMFQVRQAVAEIRARGFPATLDELAAVSQSFFAYSAIPWKSTSTTSLLPTTQASWPMGSRETSPALQVNSLPSSILMRIVPAT